MPVYLVQPRESDATPPVAEPRDISFEWLASTGNGYDAADRFVGAAAALQATDPAAQAALEVVLVGQGAGWTLSWL